MWGITNMLCALLVVLVVMFLLSYMGYVDFVKMYKDFTKKSTPVGASTTTTAPTTAPTAPASSESFKPSKLPKRPEAFEDGVMANRGFDDPAADYSNSAIDYTDSLAKNNIEDSVFQSHADYAKQLKPFRATAGYGSVRDDNQTGVKYVGNYRPRFHTKARPGDDARTTTSEYTDQLPVDITFKTRV